MLTCWGRDMVWSVLAPVQLSSRASDVRHSWPTDKTLEKSWEIFCTKLKFSDFNLTINAMFAQLIQAITHHTVIILFRSKTLQTIKPLNKKGYLILILSYFLLLHTSFITSTDKYIFSWQCCFRSLRSLGIKRLSISKLHFTFWYISLFFICYSP